MDEPVDNVLEYINSVLNDINDPAFKDLTNLIISGVDVENNLNSMFNIICETNSTLSKNIYFNNKKKTHNTSNKNNGSFNNNAKSNKKNFKETNRSIKYKDYKKLFSNNKRKLADIIWNDREDLCIDISPDINDIENEYKEIFSEPAITFNEVFGPVDYGEDCSYGSISVECLE